MGARCSSRPGVTSFSLIAQPVRLYLRQSHILVVEQIPKASLSHQEQPCALECSKAEPLYLINSSVCGIAK